LPPPARARDIRLTPAKLDVLDYMQDYDVIPSTHVKAQFSPDYARNIHTGSMLSKKSFSGAKQFFLEALVRWSENNVGGHIISGIFNRRRS
jgi:hypothetical protein